MTEKEESSFGRFDVDGPPTDSSRSTGPPGGLFSSAPAGLLTELKTFISSELTEFKDDLKRQNEHAIDKAVKRIRLEKPYTHTFKSKGNEEQHEHQEKIASHVDSAINALDHRKMYEVREALEEGKQLIATRMKHIVLADLHGWDFVNEYKLDPVAEDDLDEKRIRKVLKSVTEQREKKKAERDKKGSRFKADSSRRFQAPRLANDFAFVSPSMSTCYICGRTGHFWRTCIFRSRNASGGAINTSGFAGYAQRAPAQLQLPPPTTFTAALPK